MPKRIGLPCSMLWTRFPSGFSIQESSSRTSPSAASSLSGFG
jgi:hypothetical protein